MIEQHQMLDPTEEAVFKSVARGIELHHKVINTTELGVEESANQILDTILPSWRK
jgi:hypothetical protein